MNLQKLVRKAIAEKSETSLLILSQVCLSQGHRFHIVSDNPSPLKGTKSEEESERLKHSSQEAAGKAVAPNSMSYQAKMEKSDDELWTELEEAVDNTEYRGVGNFVAVIWPIVQALFARLFADEEQLEPVEPAEQPIKKTRKKKETETE